MIVRTLDECTDNDRDIKTPGWRSRRILLANDKLGFSVHETTLYAGTENKFWYANHIEAVFIIEGKGTLTNDDTGEVHQLVPGTIYVLNNKDHHTVRPESDIRTLCVFNPPVTGREVHDETGAYPLITEESE